MTTDDRSFAPPHEIVGQLGQVIDPGGGFVPGLAPTPVPGALGTASPGLATGAMSPAPAPRLGPDDPATLALAIARLAGEMFGGPSATSIAPVPLAPATAMTASNLQLPASPGIAPALAPSALAAPVAGMPGLASASAASSPFAVAPAFGGPGSAFGGPGSAFGGPASAFGGSAPASGGPAFGGPASAPASGGPASAGSAPAPAFGGPASASAPAFGGPVPAFGGPAPAPASGGSPFGGPASVPAFGGPASAPAFGGPAPAFGGPASAPAFGGPASAPAFGGPASAAAFGGPAPAPAFGGPAPAFGGPASGGSPFGGPAPAFGGPAFGGSAPVPGFGALGFPDALRFAIVDADVPVDAAPYFLPGADATGRGPDRGGSRIEAHDVQAEPPLVRNLGGAAFDPYLIRRDFPILEERVHGKRLVWLDNAATTQKPRAVIDRLSYFYEKENSNIHRAAHALAARATDAYEAARESVRRFLNAPSAGEIIFVRGATEGINLVARSWGQRNVAAGDEIVLTHLEHHANIVPWQQLCADTGARLRIAPVDDRGDVILEDYERLLGPRTRLVAFSQVSNALGTVTPAREMIEIAHRHGAVVLLDGAQAVSHMRVDVQALDCDFYAFSGHKVFAPTGIGAVFGKRAILEAMPPWQGGGNMIQDVTFERTTYQQPPWRFEAGTGSIGDAVGLGAALDYVTRIGIDNVNRYEHELLTYADRRLATVPGLRMIGAPRDKAGVLSFVLDGQRTEDVGSALDQEGIAVRSGHHCAQPILRRFGVEASVRASLAFYNICEDIDALVDALHRLQAGRPRNPP